MLKTVKIRIGQEAPMALAFTDRQLDVMNILWDRGSATVRQAREEMEDDLAYTSVLTVFQTLEQNGHVRHEHEGNSPRSAGKKQADRRWTTC